MHYTIRDTEIQFFTLSPLLLRLSSSFRFGKNGRTIFLPFLSPFRNKGTYYGQFVLTTCEPELTFLDRLEIKFKFS